MFGFSQGPRKTVRHVLSATTLWGAIQTAAIATAPILFWASAPTAPDETMLLLGGGLARVSAIELRRVPDDSADAPPAAADWISCPTIQPCEHSAKIVVPRSVPAGVFAVRATAGGAHGEEILVNSADPWWLQADEGQHATPGGWLRVFGSCLSFDREAVLLLLHESGDERRLKPTAQSRWELRVDLPSNLAIGRHEVIISNGYGGDRGRCSAGFVQVVPPIAWRQTVFEVAANASGDGDEEAIVAALQNAARNGGGTVLLRRGVYDMRSSIIIPPQTLLKGEDVDAVSLQWPDFDTPPEFLIKADDAAIESLSVYCRRHTTVIHSSHASQRFRMHRVRVRANAFFMHIGPGKTARGRVAPTELRAGRIVHVVGKNFQVTNCDLWGSGQVIAVDPHSFAGANRPWFGVIAGNRIAYGWQGHLLENVDRMIFEGNELFGVGSTAGGNMISTYWNNFSRNIFYARNHIHDIYGEDREAMTFDGDGSAYLGTVIAEGQRLFLDGDPIFKDHAPTPHTDYRGSAVYVLDGTGCGQYRFVTGHRDREWAVDRPWDVPLDASSIVSIVPFRGRNIFVENRIEDAGRLQLFGSAADVIVADNLTSRADGLLAWGLTQHGMGWHPILRCQFINNTVTNGGGYGARVSGLPSIAVTTTGNDNRYAGPLARAIVMRGSRLDDHAFISVDGTVADVIVERNNFSGSSAGVHVGTAAKNTVIGQNHFDDGRYRVVGPGASRVYLRKSK